MHQIACTEWRLMHEGLHQGVKSKVRDVIKELERDGWRLDRTRGGHRQFKHSTKPGLVTVPGKPGDDLGIGTLNSVWKQAGIKK